MAKVDSDLVRFDNWTDGAATRKLFEYLDSTGPEVREWLDKHPRIPHEALNSLKQDEEMAKLYGFTNEGIQNARRIIGDGKAGWIRRLQSAVKAGTILPAMAAAIALPALQQANDPEAQGSQL